MTCSLSISFVSLTLRFPSEINNKTWNIWSQRSLLTQITMESGMKLYTGITTDIEHRMKQHKAHLLYQESYEFRDEAVRREKQIKGWSRTKKLKLIDNADQQRWACPERAQRVEGNPVGGTRPRGARSAEERWKSYPSSNIPRSSDVFDLWEDPSPPPEPLEMVCEPDVDYVPWHVWLKMFQAVWSVSDRNRKIIGQIDCLGSKNGFALLRRNWFPLVANFGYSRNVRQH